VKSEILDEILSLERAALDRWCVGDPSGFLDLSAADVSYFDPFQESRLEDHGALTALYATLRGQVQISRNEIVNPRVQDLGNAAVLTFQFVSEGSEGTMRWNCTEVYRRLDGQWKIVHTHWSFVKPVLAPDAA